MRTKQGVAAYRWLSAFSVSKELCQGQQLCQSSNVVCKNDLDCSLWCQLFWLAHRLDDEIRLACHVWKWSTWREDYDCLLRFTCNRVWTELWPNVHRISAEGTKFRGVLISKKYGSQINGSHFDRITLYSNQYTSTDCASLILCTAIVCAHVRLTLPGSAVTINDTM